MTPGRLEEIKNRIGYPFDKGRNPITDELVEVVEQRDELLKGYRIAIDDLTENMQEWEAAAKELAAAASQYGAGIGNLICFCHLSGINSTESHDGMCNRLRLAIQKAFR